MSRADDPLLLRFAGSAVETPAVPAAALARALEGFQRILHLIGMRLEGRTLDRRARPSQDIQRRFVLICDLPERGSYVQPLRLAARDPQLLSDEELARAQADLSRFISAIGQKDESGLDDAVADTTYRRFMLDALADAMPEPQSDVTLEVLEGGVRLLNSLSDRAFIEEQRRPRLSAVSAGIVNGELTEIDFAERRIKLRLLGLNREIACSYTDAVEATLLEHPRELIQVYGSVSRDSRGAPRRIEAVEFIRPIREEEDLTVGDYLVGDKLVRPRHALSAKLRFDREEQLFIASAPQLQIETVGETRDDAADGFIAELRVLWRNYARAEDDSLTTPAKQLKRKLLQMFAESPDAA